MDLEQFAQELNGLQSMLAAWGEFVSTKIQDELTVKLGSNYHGFIKVPATPRVKDVSSAVTKQIKKNYQNPLEQMTDLVGVRFVVLFKTDIDIVANIIESSLAWSAIVSRDFESEIEDKPEVFDYQSRHYEIRTKSDYVHNGINIKEGLVCEVQVRTLLQHAYAEAVHDSIYKPTGVVPLKAKRYIARSMALMETTDDLFCQTIHELKEASEKRLSVFDMLYEYQNDFLKISDASVDKKINLIIIDAYKDCSFEVSKSDLDTLFRNKPSVLKTKIENRAKSIFLYKQPCVFLLYFLVDKDSEYVKEKWPFESMENEIELIFSDLGCSYNGRS